MTRLMLRLTPLLFCSLILLAACEPAQEAQETVHEAARDTIAQIDKTKVLSDFALAKPAVETYFLQNQKYPASLSELGLKLNYPDELVYDPATGKISSKSFPNLK